MRSAAWLLCVGVFACGGGKDTTAVLPEPGRPFTEEEVYPSQGEAVPESSSEAATWVDRVEHGTASVTFSELSSGAILYIETFYAAEGSPLDELSDGLRYYPTPAEFWLAFTGASEDEIPAALVRSHEEISRSERPSFDYQHLVFTGIRRKAADPNQMFPILSGMNGKCWAHSKIENTTIFRPSFGVRYACTSPTADTDFGLVRTGTMNETPPQQACPDATSTDTANEFAIVSTFFNPVDAQGQFIPANMRELVCGGQGGNGNGHIPHFWSRDCTGLLVPTTIAPGQYVRAALRNNSSPVTLGLEVQNTGETPQVRQTFGTAVSKNGVPAFGSTRCQ